MRRFHRVLVTLLLALSGPTIMAAEEVSIHGNWDDQLVSPEVTRQQEEQRRAREEAARREQQQINEELTRRGWPKSREAEVRKFLDLKKQAAALAPKPGAGAALASPSSAATSEPAGTGSVDDAHTYWERRRAQASSAKSTSDKKEEGLSPVLETIFVCTKPNEKGSFTCHSPVDTNLHGGPNSVLKVWNTPDSMAAWASSSCPGARRLHSATHLVWGCGFGATNGVNAMDRSAGVDVRGRQTFYCRDKELSCRRTSP